MSQGLWESRTLGRTRPLRLGVAALLVGALALLAGCGDDDGGSGRGGAAADLPDVPEDEWEDMTGQDTVTIDTRDNTFTPENVIVSPGTKVVWSNRGRNDHNVIPVEEGSFEQIPIEDLRPGSEASRTFDDAGEYPYYCSLHATPDRGMIGRIRVAEE